MMRAAAAAASCTARLTAVASANGARTATTIARRLGSASAARPSSTAATSRRPFSSAASSAASSSSASDPPADPANAADDTTDATPATEATDPVADSAAEADTAAADLAAAEEAAAQAAAAEAAAEDAAVDAELALAMEAAVNATPLSVDDIVFEEEDEQPTAEEMAPEARAPASAAAAASAATVARRRRRLGAAQSRGSASRPFGPGALRGALGDIALSPAHLVSPALVGPMQRLRHLLASLRLSFPTGRSSSSLVLAALEWKPEWIEMREEACELLARILKRVGSNPIAPGMRLRPPELHVLLQSMKNFRAGQQIMELLRIVLIQQEAAHAGWMERRSKALEASQEEAEGGTKTAPAQVRRQPQIISSAVAQLLELVALYSSSDLRSDAAAPDVVQGIRTAAQLLQAFQSPQMAGQFDLDSVAVAEVLKEYANLVDAPRHRRSADGDVAAETDEAAAAKQRQQSLRAMEAVRAFYDAIPPALRGSEQHSIMLTAYQRQGLWAEERALAQSLQQQSQTDSPSAAAHLEGVTNPRLTAILNELYSSPARALAAARGDFRPWVATAAEQALLDEAGALWAAAKLHPAARLNAAWVGNYLRIFRATNDVAGMVRVMHEALELEKYAHLIKPGGMTATDAAAAVAAAAAATAAQTPGEPAAAVAKVAQLPPKPLVLVHAACYSVLFSTLAQCPDPKQHLPLARAAYATMLGRFEEALTLAAQSARKDGQGAPKAAANAAVATAAAAAARGASFRAQSLLVFDSARAAYARLLVRAGASDFMSLWSSAPASEKSGNVALLTAALNHLAASGDTRRAREIVAEVTAGPTPMPMTVAVHTAWIGVCVNRGEVQEAEAIWGSMATMARQQQQQQQQRAPPTHFGRVPPQQQPVRADAQAYAQMLLVYLNAAAAHAPESAERAHMLLCMESLYCSMLEPPTQLAFSAKEFSRIIRACAARRLEEQTKLWVQRAQAVPAVFERLDNSARAIAQQFANDSDSASASTSASN